MMLRYLRESVGAFTFGLIRIWADDIWVHWWDTVSTLLFPQVMVVNSCWNDNVVTKYPRRKASSFNVMPLVSDLTARPSRPWDLIFGPRSWHTERTYGQPAPRWSFRRDKIWIASNSLGRRRRKMHFSLTYGDALLPPRSRNHPSCGS